MVAFDHQAVNSLYATNEEGFIRKVITDGSSVFFENESETYAGIVPIQMKAFKNHLVILHQNNDQ
jgi:hypothetical protein